MKILIIHYKYSVSGGPERYMFKITKALQKKGHEVIHFSINWNDNIETEQKKFWPKIKNTRGEFHLNKIQDLNLLTKLSILKNSVYNKQVFTDLNLYIKKEKPDIAYLLLFLGKLTPAVINACNKNNLPIVSRISDFSMICLNSILHDGSRICEDCINGNFSSGVIKKCSDTYSKSFAQLLIKKFYYLRNFHKKINSYIVPSKNTLNIYSKSKYYNSDKMNLLPTFINIEQHELSHSLIEKRFNTKQFVYWGRISPEKNFEQLIHTFYKLQDDLEDVKLTIIGFRNDEYSSKIIRLINQLNLSHKIEIFSFLKEHELKKIVTYSIAYIFPSKIYDNLPQSVLEALSYGLPVIASNIGSLKEIVQDGKNGYLFNPSHNLDLLNKLNLIMGDFMSYKLMSNNAIDTIKNIYNEDSHVNNLTDIFKKTLSENI